MIFCHKKVIKDGLFQEPGDCKAMIPSWYFDNELQKCLEFVYSGCKGNLNNFESERECNNICVRSERDYLTVPDRPDPRFDPKPDQKSEPKSKSISNGKFLFMSLLLFLSCFSGHFWSAFLVLQLLAIKRSRRTTKLDLKCPEKGLEK